MNKLSDAIAEVVMENPMLQLAVRHRLLNLSQASLYLQPLIEARLKKEVTASSITMGLSRLQRSMGESKQRRVEEHFSLENLFVTSDLAVVCFPNTLGVRREVHHAYGTIHKRGRFVTVTQGVGQVTVITDRSELDNLLRHVPEKPISKEPDISALGVSFRKEYASAPGFFAAVFQQLYLQNINVVEVASTATELVVYLQDQDVRLAFDSLYNRFVAKRSR